jgi:hypothetical protein
MKVAKNQVESLVAKRVQGFLAGRCGDDKELPGQKQHKQLSQDLGVFDQQYPFHGLF